MKFWHSQMYQNKGRQWSCAAFFFGVQYSKYPVFTEACSYCLKNRRLLTSPLLYLQDYERWHSHFFFLFCLLTSPSFILSYSLSLWPSLSKQASRQSVQSSLLIANSHGWMESQLFPSALSMLHFSSYPLLPWLTALVYSLIWFQNNFIKWAGGVHFR